MHYKNILHFTVTDHITGKKEEVLNMNIQGADRIKASAIARDVMKTLPKLFSGRQVEVSIEYVYSVPDGSGCVDFEFDVEPMGIYKGPRTSRAMVTPVSEDDEPVK